MNMNEFPERRFDKEGRPRGWHTAFYYLAEHVKFLTAGSINHKGLYALVGVDGTVNDANPRIRKNVAGKLSTIVHSKEYAADMQARHQSHSASFDEAACGICAASRKVQGWGDAELRSYLASSCWPDVWRGLNNEKGEWRASLDLERIRREARLVFDDRRRESDATAVLSAILRLISFGYLEVPVAHLLEPATAPASASLIVSPGNWTPCLVRYPDQSCSVISGFWKLSKGKTFTIGRFTDCDSVESDKRIGREHGRVFFKDGRWFYEDLHSLNGSAIVRDGRKMDCAAQGAPEPVALLLEDRIVVAGTSCYWFGQYGDFSR